MWKIFDGRGIKHLYDTLSGYNRGYKHHLKFWLWSSLRYPDITKDMKCYQALCDDGTLKWKLIKEHKVI